MVKYVLLRGKSGGWSTFGGIKSVRVEKRKKRDSLFGAFWGALVRGRIQSGLPLTSGADPSCSPDCQDQQPRAPGATFCDMVKYVLLRGKSGGWSTFGGIKSGPVEKRNFPGGPFWAFLRPSRVLGPKMSLNPPQKGWASKGEIPKWTSPY